MNEKKHIDRLFQEKFKDFEVAPDDVIWDQIHDRLHEDKRKRRLIPIWWRAAGVAAILLLLLTVGIQLMSSDFDSDTVNPVVDTENRVPNKFNATDTISAENPVTFESDNANEVRRENTSNVVTENGSHDDPLSNDRFNETLAGPSEKNRWNQNAATVSENDINKIVDNDKSRSDKNSAQGDLNNNENISKRYSQKYQKNNTKNGVAIMSNRDENNSIQNNLDTKREKTVLDKMIKDSNNNSNSKLTEASEKIEHIIAEDSREELKQETLKDITIEEAIAEAHTEDEKERKLNRWNISPNVAPVYFSSLGQGSTLDEQFVDNNKSNEITMSYGIGGSYAINKRVKIRAGINKVDMGYSTNNVIAFRNIDASRQSELHMENVKINGNGDHLTFMSTATLNRNETPEIINSKSDGSINQRFGFIEVPLEMEYALINKKFGINVIGGFSTLIVDKNEIYSVVDGTETLIGEANNINGTSYSANFGFGINYNISEKIKLNLEPTLKYQINTFNNSAGEVQPYFIGVYTGLSYKF